MAVAIKLTRCNVVLLTVVWWLYLLTNVTLPKSSAMILIENLKLTNRKFIKMYRFRGNYKTMVFHGLPHPLDN